MHGIIVVVAKCRCAVKLQQFEMEGVLVVIG